MKEKLLKLGSRELSVDRIRAAADLTSAVMVDYSSDDMKSNKYSAGFTRLVGHGMRSRNPAPNMTVQS